MTFGYPWVIQGINEIPLDMARVLAYAATNGQEGVIGPGDLFVQQSPTPGMSVMLKAGAFAANAGFSSNVGQSQSYVGYTDSDIFSIPISAAPGSGTRYDLVWVQVTDPGEAGNSGTPTPVAVQVQTGVGSTCNSIASSGVLTNVTGIALARIAVPAGASSITNSNITDLRHSVIDQNRLYEKIFNKISGSEQMPNTFGTWPNNASWSSIDVPKYATKAQIVMWISGIKAGDALNNTVNGTMRINFGGTYSTNQPTFNETVNSGSVEKFMFMIGDELNVTSAMRGTRQTISLEAKLNNGASTGNAYAVQGTTVIMQVRFYNAADAAWWT